LAASSYLVGAWALGGIRALWNTVHVIGRRRDENNRDYIRWCFADPAAAKELTEAFADMIG
jgi:hypothetical protein